jgi:flagellar biosynthesis/type III secretory pathway protein FliH
LFRIDRRFVNLASSKFHKHGNKNEPEVGAEGDFPDAAASAEALANEYLSAAEKEAKTKTYEILANARTMADQIITEARDEAMEEAKRAWQAGFDDGAIAGKKSFDEKLAEKMQEDEETLKNVLDEVNRERERAREELESDVVDLALDIVRKIINPPDEAIGDVFTPLIKNALRQMPTDGKMVIRVGTAEYERFFSSGGAVFELDSGVTVKATVLKDAALQEGDCIIDTDGVTVNAGIESQLQYVKLAFERANQYEPD